MITIDIDEIPDFDDWRIKARYCLYNNISPNKIIWKVKGQFQDSLFEESPIDFNNVKEFNIKINKEFLELIKSAICHTDENKYDLIYRVLWRICFKNKNLLRLKTDNDIIKFNKLVKQVRRDAYKISAFLRFRSTIYNDEEHFIAWYEPEFYSLELKLHFFKTRFKNMNWSILTPYLAAHWNKSEIILEKNPDKKLYPKNDLIEDYWVTYYASIFNPARVKKQAMLNQMPKKYWKNMPETKIIEDLLKSSEAKAIEMINKSNN